MSTVINPDAYQIAIEVVLIFVAALSFFKSMSHFMIWLNARMHDSVLFQARAMETSTYVPEAVIKSLILQVKPGEKAGVYTVMWSTFTFFLIMLRGML